MQGESRRSFLQLCRTAFTASLVPYGMRFSPQQTPKGESFWGNTAFAQQADLPSFLLVLYVSGGVAPHYLFDGRSRAFTAAGIIENYTPGSGEPTLIQDDESNQTFIAPAAVPLLKHRDLFSIVNGVYMAPSFNGHNENRNFLFTNSPFGGDTFLAAHAKNPTQVPLGFFIDRAIGARIQNINLGMELSLQGLLSVCSSVSVPSDSQATDLLEFRESGSPLAQAIVSSRMEEIGKGNGLFASGSRNLAAAMAQSSLVRRRMQRVAELQPNASATTLIERLEVCASLFEAGLTTVIAMDITPSVQLDTHSPQLAAQQPRAYAQVAQSLDTFFSFFRSRTIRPPLPVAPGVRAAERPLQECCSFLIASEFGRTYRQKNRPIDKTGTDHNPHGNSVLVGGHGIRTGRILGSTDVDTLDRNGSLETKRLVTDHLTLDPDLLCGMGRPFDFKNGRSLIDAQGTSLASRPESFIHIGNVLNTLAAASTVSPSRWLRPSSGMPNVYQPVAQLLARGA